MSRIRRIALCVALLLAACLVHPLGGSRGPLAGVALGDDDTQVAAVRTSQVPHGDREHRDQGRIRGRLVGSPECTVEALEPTGKPVKAVTAGLETDRYVLEWLTPGTYALRVTADGGQAFFTTGLVVKAGFDLHVDLKFQGAATDDVAAEDSSAGVSASADGQSVPPWTLLPGRRPSIRTAEPRPAPKIDKPKSGKKKDKDKAKQNQKRKRKKRGKGKRKKR